jgi:hypothetical protein
MCSEQDARVVRDTYHAVFGQPVTDFPGFAALVKEFDVDTILEAIHARGAKPAFPYLRRICLRLLREKRERGREPKPPPPPDELRAPADDPVLKALDERIAQVARAHTLG